MWRWRAAAAGTVASASSPCSPWSSRVLMAETEATVVTCYSRRGTGPGTWATSRRGSSPVTGSRAETRTCTARTPGTPWSRCPRGRSSGTRTATSWATSATTAAASWQHEAAPGARVTVTSARRSDGRRRWRSAARTGRSSPTRWSCGPWRTWA